jgi:hypothetical protein
MREVEEIAKRQARTTSKVDANEPIGVDPTTSFNQVDSTVDVKQYLYIEQLDRRCKAISIHRTTRPKQLSNIEATSIREAIYRPS